MAHRMKCKNAILNMIEGITPPLKGNQRKAAGVAREERRPLMWRVLEMWLRHLYFEETGERIGAGFDWAVILNWLYEHRAEILAFILQFFV